MPGLLMGGQELLVGGLSIINRNDVSWAKLDTGDYKVRNHKWVRQIIIHTTKGIWPQHVKSGKGPTGADRIVADYWARDPQHSGAHLVVDRDGDVVCLADLLRHAAFHATTSNEWSVGIEMYQEADGGIYQAVLDSTVKLVHALCLALNIPDQIAADGWRPNTIIDRMLHGGPDCIGIFGHRDQAWKFPEWLSLQDRAHYPKGYAGRGRGDPGDLIYDMLVKSGSEPLNFGRGDDKLVWRRRQARLNSWGAKLAVDGVCGPGTVAAMRSFGLSHGRDIDSAVEAPTGVV